jgi:uncharacterized protein (DUF1330 family)
MFKNALLVTASIIVGAGGVQFLHAQSNAPAYFLAAVNVKDQDGYAKNFLPVAQKSIKEHGGVYVAGGFEKTTVLDGMAAPNRVVLIKFDNFDTAKKWWATNGKKETDEIGIKYAEFKASWVIQGAEPK